MTSLNLRAVPLDILSTVGDSITLEVTCLDGVSDPVDVSSYTIVAVVYRSGITVETFGDAVSGAGSNVITLTLTGAQTTTIGNEPGATWSMSVTNGADTQQWLAGEFELVAPGNPRAGSNSGSATLVVDGTVTVTITESSGGGSGDLLSTNNLSDLANVVTARTNLGLGTAAVLNSVQIPFTYEYTIPGDLATGTGVVKIPIRHTETIVDVHAELNTAPTGATAIFDVNKNGTTIFTTQSGRPTVAISATEDTSGTPDVTALADGDALTVDVDQIGSTIAGSDAVIQVNVLRTVALS